MADEEKAAEQEAAKAEAAEAEQAPSTESKANARDEKPAGRATDETSSASAGKPAENDASSQSDSERGAPAGTARRGRGRGVRVSPVGIAHIQATFNNTLVSITDTTGAVVAWSSAGRAGFKGSRKSTAFAATVVGQDAARQASSKGMNEVEVRVQGAGSGRESAIRALQSSGLNISVIKDVTPMPHNGCRARKRRRV